MKEILNAFENMNTSFFETFNVLGNDDERVTKYLRKKMIKEMVEVFNLFKDTGDTELYEIKTTCGSDVCSDFKSSIFYCFVGNNSKNYCLVKIQHFNDVPGAIMFCSSILKPKGIELGRFIEPYDEYADGMPF